MDVYILGAGFSKGLYDRMPTMRELGICVFEELGLSPEELESFHNDFEAWLSHLAQREPWLSTEETLENMAMFQRASTAIGRVLRAAHPPKYWKSPPVINMLKSWSEQSAQVVTFNYDLILENLLTDLVIEGQARDLYALPLTSRTDTQGFLAPRPPSKDRPTLFKLHGSLNWLYGGQDDARTPIVIMDDTRSPYLYDDLLPLIIPPTSTKSPFYEHTGLRAQWRNAFKQVQRADRLIVIGYSMPKTDLQVRTMLNTGLREQVELVVVDYDASVPDHIAEMLPTTVPGRHFTGTNAVLDFARSQDWRKPHLDAS